MKKIFLITQILAVTTLVLTGCLKDKGFDNKTYGINDPDTQPPGVGFALGTGVKAINGYGLDAVSSTLQVVNGLVYINLESGLPAPADIKITIAINDAVIGRYNANPDLSDIDTLNHGLFNLPTLSLTIPKGQRNVEIPINVPNTTTLNLAKSYGIGLTITSVDGGYIIASNLKDLLISFSLKNKYDGKYSWKGYALRLNDPGLTGNFTGVSCELATTGPNSVIMDQLLLWGDGQSGIGIGVVTFNVNPATNKVTFSSSGGATNLPGYDSRWDDPSKTFYLGITWGAGPTARQSIDTMTRTGPR
jgi:hypothetical protein